MAGKSSESDKSKVKHYNIGAVARLTGISTHTLRVWERRHEAVKLDRTESGRRLYTTADVERLSLLKRLVDRGESIGRVAGLTGEQLEKRLEEFERHTAKRLHNSPGPQRVAIFGEFLGVPVEDGLANAEIVARGSRLQRFRSDIAHTQSDVLVMEIPIVNADTIDQLVNLSRECGAERVVAVYDFGRRADVALLAEHCTTVLRAPVSAQDLERAIVAAALPAPDSVPAKNPAASPPTPGAATGLGDAPRRHYTRRQLAQLAQVSTTVECECPQHLVDLIDRLSAFEEYSADCENRNRKDAALHAYLHNSTAHARALIEIALARIIEVEDLDPGPA